MTTVNFIVTILIFSITASLTGCLNNNDAPLVVQQLQAPMNLRPNATVLMVNETKRFFAEGGVPPYQYKIKSGQGTIDISSGVFVAPSSPQAVTLEISDSSNQTFTKSIQIIEQLHIISSVSYLIETANTTFSASGGQAPYTYTTIMGQGTVDSSSGLFVAPNTAGSAIVQVMDSYGYTDTKLITIIPRIQISPSSGSYPVNSKVLFSALGGQPPVSFSIASGNASIDAMTGLLSFGSTPGAILVVATDSLGFTTQVTVNSFYSKLVSTGGKNTPFSCGVNIYGRVQCWGFGNYLGYENVYWGEDNTQLGAALLTKTINNFSGITVSDISNFSQRTWDGAYYAQDWEHACALLSDSSVRCWGSNSRRNLGTGTYTNYWVGTNKPNLPTIDLGLTGGVTVSKLATGQSNKFSCALLSNQTIKCWGANDSYQVSPNIGDQNPVAINIGTGVLATDIKLGGSHICARTSDKKVKCWGANGSGQLGISQTGTTYGGPNQMGDNLPYLNFGVGVTVEEIAVGFAHSCARLTDGSVKCWGNNSSGQLGLGVTTSTFGNSIGFNLATHPAVNLGTNPGTGLPFAVTRIFAFGNRTCALREDSALKCWGNNSSEVLGIGKSGAPYDKIGDAPNEVDNDSVSLVDLGSNVTLLDLNSYYSSIDYASSSTCALLLDNTDLKHKIKCWGKNTNGELGYGLPSSTSPSVTIGDQAGEMGSSLPFVDTGGLDVLKTSLGPYFTCALLSDQQVHCWGQTTDTNGLESPTKADQPSEFGPFSPTVDLGTTTRVINIQSKRYNTCAIFVDGQAKCWGTNLSGSLGLGDLNPRGLRKNTMGINLPFLNLGTGFKVKSIAMGSAHMCALSDTGRVKCWGAGANGRLGVGSAIDLGDGPNEMGDNLPYVDLGTDNQGSPLLATKVTAGDKFSCALLNNQKTKCWGNNLNGELGLNDGYLVANPDIGNSPTEMGNNLKYVDLGPSDTIVDISSGFNHTCVVLSNFTLKCWGLNTNGQLGYEDTTPRGKIAGSMSTLQVVNLGTDTKAISVFTGPISTCVIFIDGKLKCFGYNAFGQLGLESNLSNPYTSTQLAFNIGDNFNEMGDHLPYVNLGTGLGAYLISMEDYHSCAVLTNGEIKCWGLNSSGALGYGDKTNRGNSLNTMGDFLNQLLF